MTEQLLDVEAVLADLKDFQRRTARRAFERMFADRDAATRFLVADEVGLGKTHVAKGVIAQVIDHLRRTDDKRHDIVYVCSNAAIARQNIRKLAPESIEPLEDVDRLTMLASAELNDGDAGQVGVNLLAITPGTSLKFGRNTGRFPERCLAYAFLRAHWGGSVMIRRARWVFWHGVRVNPDERLQREERRFRPLIEGSLGDFAELLTESDETRRRQRKPTVRAIFERLVEGLVWKRKFPDDLLEQRSELIGEVRRIMATVGIAALRPDLVVLDEFQRFKDLLRPEPDNFAAELAHRLFDYKDPATGRATRTLLLSATPYRMYTTADETDGNHYEDFLDTCSFLLQDPTRVDDLKRRFNALRDALFSRKPPSDAESICEGIGTHLRKVMSRTERLAATPDRDGMLHELEAEVQVGPDDLGAYLRLGDLAETVEHHEPTEYWKSGPYLVNFMERYKLKEAVVRAAEDGRLAGDDRLQPGLGLLNWDEIEVYQHVDPQNGRLRWLIHDLERHRAFQLLWIPPSMRYYDAGSVYESAEAASFTKRLIFSGWAVVPKVVSSLVSFEAERRAFATRSHNYTTDYRGRGGQRLRAAAMTAFLLTWPSPSLAEFGDPRPLARREGRLVSEVLDDVVAKVANAVEPLVRRASSVGAADQRWYWAAPLFLDRQLHPSAPRLLLAQGAESLWEGDQAGGGLRAHLAEARAMAERGPEALGRTPDDLVEVLAKLAVGGPAQCALRMISSVSGLPTSHDSVVKNAARVGAAFRSFFNAPEVTAVIVGADSEESDTDERAGRYWRDVIRHSIDGNLQAVLDEHAHVLRDWLGYLNFVDDSRRMAAADDIASSVAEALELRTSSFRVDIPSQRRSGDGIEFQKRQMRTRFAVAFGNQTLDDGGEARVESVSRAFNSPFWPFVLVSTSIGQEGLDFHLWCHAVVHWNLPSNPVDLEQREGRVHRYKGHAVRRNVATTLGPELRANGMSGKVDPWSDLFAMAVAKRVEVDAEMVPYWVFHQGPAKIERHVPVMPFSRDAAALPRLRKTLAAYRLAFGQPRQEELVEFLGADRSDEDLLQLASRLCIDLSPPRDPVS